MITYSQQNSMTVVGTLQSNRNDTSKEEVANYLIEAGWINSSIEGGKINLNSSAVMGFEVVALNIIDVENVDENNNSAKEEPQPNESRYTEDEDEENYYAYVEFTLGKAHHQVLLPVDYEYNTMQEQLESLPFVKDATTHKWVSFLSNRKPIVTKELNLTEDEIIDFMGGKKDE